MTRHRRDDRDCNRNIRVPTKLNVDGFIMRSVSSENRRKEMKQEKMERQVETQ